VEHNLWRIFRAVSTAAGEREAIVWRGRRLTYGGLADRTQRLAAVLSNAGLGVRRERVEVADWESGQDSIGLLLLNCPEYLEASLGSYGARTAPFNVNYRYVVDELAYLLNDASASALIYHSQFAETVAQVLPRLDRDPLLIQVADESGATLLPGAVDYETALAEAKLARAEPNHSPDDLYLLYTGGTTGMPKGTLWRQADIWVAALGGDRFPADADLSAIGSAAISFEWRVLPIAPFMHGAAHWLALRCLLSGGTVVINNVVDRFDASDFWSTVERERVGATLLVGEAFARPLIAELETGSYDTQTLRVVSVGGAVTSPETKNHLLTLLPQALVVDLAGSSETGSALSQVSRTGSQPEYGIFERRDDVSVLNIEHQRILEPGTPEIGWLAKSGNIPLGYLGDQAKTESTFPTIAGTRWSVPGDRARLRHDGMVELLGRDSATINSGGEKIFAEEVERALLNVACVEDVLVVGRPSERWGEQVVAVVQLASGSEATDAELVSGASQHIARFKLPKAIIRVQQVERSPAGKANYAWAQKIAGEIE
jgi:3-oxocholest-4-en-26-oate---CoA ligase